MFQGQRQAGTQPRIGGGEGIVIKKQFSPSKKKSVCTPTPGSSNFQGGSIPTISPFG
jgi:hypothetical protein